MRTMLPPNRCRQRFAVELHRDHHVVVADDCGSARAVLLRLVDFHDEELHVRPLCRHLGLADEGIRAHMISSATSFAAAIVRGDAA